MCSTACANLYEVLKVLLVRSSPATYQGNVAPLPAESPANENWLIERGSIDRADIVVCCAIAAIIVAVFWHAVFLGRSISKISLLPEWDSFYSHLWTGANMHCDPSVVQLIAPYCFLAAKLWHSGTLPLWNPYSGAGMPFVADLQAAPFSPLRMLFFLCPSSWTYNFSLVTQVILSGAGTYLCCRQLLLPRYAAAMAAFAYALCPFNLHYLELASGTSACLFPLLFFLFIRLSARPSLLRSALAGAGCALLIMSGHPEASFFGIAFGCATMAALMIAEKPRLSTVARIVGVTGGTGLIAFCLSAPVLLPFVEYLRNSESYKFDIGGSTWVPWQALGYNLFLPGFGGASPYLGAVAAVFLPGLIFIRTLLVRRWAALAAVAALAFAITARLGAFDHLFSTSPFNTLITVYCLPVVLLLLCVLSAAGLSEFVRVRDPGRLTALVLGTGIAIAVPILLQVLHAKLSVGDFDMMLPHMAFNANLWLRELLLAVLLCACLLLPVRAAWWRFWLVPLACLIVSFCSQVAVSKSSLANLQNFDYPVLQPLPLLQASNERMVALGDHLLKPNTCAVYGVADLRTHNVIFPSRFLPFVKSAGARVDTFNQLFESSDNCLLDLASVRYVLSLHRLKDAGTLRLVQASDQPAYLYERKSYLPRAYFVHRAVLAVPNASVLQYLSSSAFSSREEVVLEKPISLPDFQTAHASDESITELNVRPNVVQMNVKLHSPAVVVLTDVFYPGWSASVDGRPTELLRANYLFRGTIAPAGCHHIVFSYAPLSFRIGIWLAISCLAVVSTLSLIQRRGGTRFKPQQVFDRGRAA